MAASRGGGRHRAGSIRHESDLLSTLRLSRSDALAPRRRRSLSTQSHPPARRSPVDPLRAPAEMPTALSQPRVRADIQVASRPSSRSAPPSNPHSARCTTAAQLPATSCLGAFWTPAATARGRVRHAGVQKPEHLRTYRNQNRPKRPRREALRLNYGSPFVTVNGLNPRSARAAHEAAPRCGNRK